MNFVIGTMSLGLRMTHVAEAAQESARWALGFLGGVQRQQHCDLCCNFCHLGQTCASCSALNVQAVALFALQHHQQFIWSVIVFQACRHLCFLLAMMLVVKIGWLVTAALLRRNNSTALQEAAVGLRVGEKALTSNYGKHICYLILKHDWCALP